MINANAKAIFNVRLDRLNSAEESIEEAKQLLNLRREVFAKAYSPFSVGEEIEIPKCAFTHTGKRGKITSVIVIKNYADKWEWKMFGLVLKKDGKESKLTFKFKAEIEPLK